MTDEGMIFKRSDTTRIAVRLISALGKDWVAVCIEKMIRDKWILSKSIQLLPEEWEKIREITIGG